eukprot:jgi/Botrbrau1/18352/Bobra.0179s0077.1
MPGLLGFALLDVICPAFVLFLPGNALLDPSQPQTSHQHLQAHFQDWLVRRPFPPMVASRQAQWARQMLFVYEIGMTKTTATSFPFPP